MTGRTRGAEDRAVVIAGPTCSGKTALALEVALEVGGEIVNADAFQLYRGLEILTASPGEDERARVAHHLYGVLDPGASCDAGRYAGMARAAMDEVRARGRVPVLVGGSGLYIKAVTHGLDDLPCADVALRHELAGREMADKLEQLRALDPETWESIDHSNPRYVDRALEICLLTGRRASDLRRSFGRPLPPEFRGIVIEREREELWRRIRARTEWMVEAGAIEEVARLGEVRGGLDKAIGYRPIREHLAGRPLEEVLEDICVQTRRYAKRQANWFRREEGFLVLSP